MYELSWYLPKNFWRKKYHQLDMPQFWHVDVNGSLKIHFFSWKILLVLVACERSSVQNSLIKREWGGREGRGEEENWIYWLKELWRPKVMFVSAEAGVGSQSLPSASQQSFRQIVLIIFYYRMTCSQRRWQLAIANLHNSKFVTLEKKDLFLLIQHISTNMSLEEGIQTTCCPRA